MGHYFLKPNCEEVVGINNSGLMLIARTDLLNPILNEAIEKAKNICNLSATEIVNYGLFYPRGYISQIDARRGNKKFFDYEKTIYEIVRPKLYQKYVEFHATEVTRRLSSDFLCEVLSIFFCIGSKLTYQSFNDGSIITVAEKPSGINTFFTGREVGKTLGTIQTSKLSEIQFNENELSFFEKTHNFMTVTRERCYT